MPTVPIGAPPLPPLNLTGGSSGRSTVAPNLTLGPVSIGSGRAAQSVPTPGTSAIASVLDGPSLPMLAVGGLGLLVLGGAVGWILTRG